MVLKYASQIAALNAALAKLDADLARNPHWQSPTQKTHPTPSSSTGIDSIFAQLHREQELARDPVYRARVKLLEAVQILQQISTEIISNGDGRDDVVKLQPTNSGSALSAQSSPSQVAENSAAAESASARELSDSVTARGEPPQSPVSDQDDLMRIRGVTRSLNENLKALGVTRFAQIADWTSADRHAISRHLGLDREISRQNWIEQAALLAAKSGSLQATPATPVPDSKIQPDAQHERAPVKSQSVKIAPSAIGATPVPPPLNPQPVEVPHVLIKSAAHGVIRRLQASNDTQPNNAKAQQTTATPAPAAPAAPPRPAISQDARPRSPQPQIAFSPQILPEPRRVLAGQERRQDKSTDGNGREDRMGPDRANAAAIDKTSAAPEPPKEEPKRAATPPLPKEKLRFRRLKPKSKPEPQPIQSARPPAVPQHQSEDCDVDVVIRKTTSAPSARDLDALATRAKSTSVNPLAPPPVPKPPKQPSAFNKRRWQRQRTQHSAPRGGRPSFGDGQTWRQPDPVLTGPILNDDVTLDSKIYAHTEEASVEIVRPRATAEAARDPLASPSRISSKAEHEAGTTDQSVKSARHHPAKRIFSALKRE